MAAIGVGAALAQGFAIGPQPVSEVTGSVSDASKAELISRVKRWVALTFDRSDVIDLADPVAGTVVLKWGVRLQHPCRTGRAFHIRHRKKVIRRQHGVAGGRAA